MTMINGLVLLGVCFLIFSLHIGYFDYQHKRGPVVYPNYQKRITSPHRKEKPNILKKLSKKNCLVTGANGFFGVTIVEQLLLDGWHVLALHRKTSDVSLLSSFLKNDYSETGGFLELISGDITDYDSLIRAIPYELPAVFHLAASLNFWSGRNNINYAVNVLGTRNVVNACLERNVGKLIHTSSGSVYDGPDNPYETSPHKFDETAEKLAKYGWVGYGSSKYLAEEEILAGIEDGQWAVIMNPFYIVGKYDSRSLGQLVQLLAKGELSAIPPANNSFGHAGEIARAHIAASKVGRLGENYLLGGNGSHPVSELIAAMAKHGKIQDKMPSSVSPYWMLSVWGTISDYIAYWTGSPPEVPFIPSELAFEISMNADPDCTKARNVLGYKDNFSVDELAHELVTWLIENNYIETPDDSTATG